MELNRNMLFSQKPAALEQSKVYQRENKQNETIINEG